MEATFEKIVGPVKELNDLTLKSIEQISSIQVKSVQESAQISMDSLKSSTEITDLDTLQTYLKNQLAIAQDLSNKAVENAEQIAKLSEDYANNVKSLIEKSVS